MQALHVYTQCHTSYIKFIKGNKMKKKLHQKSVKYAFNRSVTKKHDNFIAD